MKISKVSNLFRYASDLDALDLAVMPADVPYPKPGALWWLATDNGVQVGFCGLKRWNDSTGFLCRAGVLRSARGQGLHRRLIAVREAAARKMGLSLLVTYVAAHNLKSANNLIRCGYILYAPQYKWGCDGCLYFRKEI